MNTNEELVEVVDEQNHVIEIVPRSIVRQKNLLHRASYIFVFSPLGALCVQRRTSSKDAFPNYWDLAAGGIPMCEESYDNAAKRELGEELGIYHQSLNKHASFLYEDEQCRLWGQTYSLIWDGDIIPQTSEIAEWRYLSIEDIPIFLTTENISPPTKQAYHTLLEIGSDD